MKLIWVKAGGLVPLDTGGKIRSYHLLKELARKYEVTFFSFYGEHADDQHHELEKVFYRVVTCPLRLPKAKGATEMLHYARNLFGPWPHSFAKFCRPEVSRRLLELLKKEQFDIIICDFLLAASVIPWDLACPKILFTHNVEALIWKRHYEVARNPLWKAVAWREYRTMARMESRYLSLADHVLAVSDADRDVFAREIPLGNITVIPTGVDVDYFRPALEPADPNTLVFTGSMDWMPNEDAIHYFVDEIWPLIRAEVPGVKFSVVGRRPTERLRKVAAQAGIEVTGAVDDIRPYVHRAAVYVVPLRVGSGTRLKIFEAMAMGKAVVSTTIGAEGLPVHSGENILLADTPQDFAAAVIRFLRDPTLRDHLGGSARQLVQEKYSWSAAARELENVLVRRGRLAGGQEWS
jgi:sugar transferase (PEP-CTERM/EpsH1 system associated)